VWVHTHTETTKTPTKVEEWGFWGVVLPLFMVVFGGLASERRVWKNRWLHWCFESLLKMQEVTCEWIFS
jgi:hypothetical protein